MADSTESSIVIDAAPGAILDVIADFDRYPEWAGQVKKVALISEDGDGWADQVEFTLSAGAIKDAYVLEYDWDVADDGTGVVSWHLVTAQVLKEKIEKIFERVESCACTSRPITTSYLSALTTPPPRRRARPVRPDREADGGATRCAPHRRRRRGSRSPRRGAAR